LREDRVHVMGWRSAPGLRQRITAANTRKELQFDFQPEVTADSDHYPFFVARRPVLHFDTGKHDDYHRPSDDVEKVNWDGLAMIAQFLQSLIREAATTESLPTFRMESLSEKPPRIATTRTAATPRLGLSWDPARLEQAQQFVVFAVTRGTPAERAGLLPGDRIEAVNETTPQSLSEMRAILNDAVDTVSFRWQRPGQTVPITRAIRLMGTPVRIGWQYRLDPALPGCAVIQQIIDSSRADRCGIEPGDVLLPLESGIDWPAKSAEFETLPQLTEAPKIRLRLERAGRLIDCTLEPVPRSPLSERSPAP
jgi:aminopeptidase YwaD